MDLKEIFNLPQKSIINKKIPKNQFQKLISKKEFDIFTSDIESIYIHAILNKITTNIMPLQNEDYNVSEIMIFKIELRNKNNIKNIRNIIHNTIPNPVILILSFRETIDISLTMKRLNKNDSTKVIVNEIISSGFLDLKNPNEYENKFLNNIKITNLSQLNLYEMYKEMEKLVLATTLFEYIQNYISNADNIDEVLGLILYYESLDKKINEYEKCRKSESSFGRQMEWYVKIKKVEKSLKNIKEKMEVLC